MKRIIQLGFLSMSFALFASQLQAEEAITVIVDAGKFSRTDCPISLPFNATAEQATAKSVYLVDESGQVLLGQLTKPGLLAKRSKKIPKASHELHFILPELAKGESITYEVKFSDEPSDWPTFAFAESADDATDLLYKEKPVLRYIHPTFDDSSAETREATYKVFHHVFDPSGERIVTKGPGGLFTHHRGLFYGFNKIRYAEGQKEADTWHSRGKAYTSHEKSLSEEAGPILGRHRVMINWHGQEGEVFLTEQREMTVYAVSDGHLIEFASKLQTKVGHVELDGDPQHAGFQFRAHNEVADSNQNLTYYLRPDGKGEMGQTKNWGKRPQKGETEDFVNLPWDVMSFVLGEQRYSVARIDHPKNPREARFSERPYGRFGSYFEYHLTEEKPLKLNYRVWLQEGEMKKPEVVALKNDFNAPPKASLVSAVPEAE
ncbi:Hypothetical protein PBC10988_40790 [Planctomycetales bacterium 10988]|nr:Hypothetical protein PBC10988_40790 [Planctomycetales bacterium 10988]